MSLTAFASPPESATRTQPDACHWIGGAWRSSARTMPSVSPATGELLGTFADGSVEEAREAVVAARAAFDATDWSRQPEMRSRAILALADHIERRLPEIALMLARENGKLLAETSWEVGGAAVWLRHSAAAALTLLKGEALAGSDGSLVTRLAQPKGVVAVISLWNSPLILTVRDLGPALAAGCTVVVKLPGHTGLTNGLFSEAVAAAGFPPGVINVLTERNGDGARHFVSSPLVDKVAFTGSTATGRAIAAECAKTLKPVSLELGGKTPLVVFEDADIDAVVPVAVSALLRMNGQFCCTGSRLLVHRDVADRLRDAMVAALNAVTVGAPEDPASQLGPVINREAVERLDRLVEEASSYATVLVRGGSVAEGPLARGAYFRPALLEVEEPDVSVVQQELFGPVLVMEVFADEADAIRRANATEYGLAACVFTADRPRARRVARAIDAGLIWLNAWGPLPSEFSAGGFKQSGTGVAGPTAVEELLDYKLHVEAA